MNRKSTANPARDLAAMAFLVVAANGIYGPASAGSRQSQHNTPADHGTLAGPPVMAIVSMKDQRISLYDAAGGAMRARVSSGRTDYETPVGTYSILQKNRDHYSNVYDAAAMPFMQRITWSGVALHEGQLPGYPASHGCVRLPYSFAEQIFPLTKIGMRVIVARDDVAPVDFSHPLLLKPAPLPESVVATKAAYVDSDSQQQNGSVFQADVRNWPQRQAEMDALKATAAERASQAELTKGPVADLKALLAAKTSQRAAAAKILRAAEKVKRIADERSARTERELASAKDPAKLKKFENAKTQADADVVTATERLTTATAAVQATTSERQRARAERAVRIAERAKRVALNQVARTERELIDAKSPLRFKKQEDAAAKVAAAAIAAGQKHTSAAEALQAAETGLQRTTQELATAVTTMETAVAAARGAERKTFPVSIFVSLKTQRLYVRQGHEPVTDVPVTISEPGQPVGTHIFTAVDYQKDGAGLRWTAVSLARRPMSDSAKLSDKSRRRNDAASEPYPANAALASAALDRFTIPPEIAQRFSESIWPGSSLIVSDEGLSKETGNATDFVVLMSGEPQGGIKRRPRPAPVPQYNGYGTYYGSSGYLNYDRYDRYGRPIRIQQRLKPKPIFSWW